MTDIATDISHDLSFARGMRLALAMAAQGAEARAHEVAAKLTEDALAARATLKAEHLQLENRHDRLRAD